MSLMTRIDTAKFLAMSTHGLEKLVKTDPSFPRPIKLGEQMNSRVYFEREEIQTWIDAHKAERAEVQP